MSSDMQNERTLDPLRTGREGIREGQMISRVDNESQGDTTTNVRRKVTRGLTQLLAHAVRFLARFSLCFYSARPSKLGGSNLTSQRRAKASQWGGRTNERKD